MHLGRPIDSIVRERLEKMQHNINRVLRVKEMDLHEKLRRLDRTYVQAKYIGNYISNATYSFFEGILVENRSHFERQKSFVSRVLSSIQEDLQRITKIIYEANYTVSNNRHIDYLDAYNRLMKQSEYMYFKKQESKSAF